MRDALSSIFLNTFSNIRILIVNQFLKRKQEDSLGFADTDEI